MDLPFAKLKKHALIRSFRGRLHEEFSRWSREDGADAVIEGLRAQQAELEQQNQRLRAAQLSLETALSHQADLYHGAPVGICTLDMQGVIREINTAGVELLGATREHLIGVPFAFFTVESDRPRFWTHVRTCIASEGRVTSELALSSKKFTSLIVQLVSVRARENGVVTGCRTSLVNVSGIKKAEARLRLLSVTGQKLAGSLDYRGVLGSVVQLAVPTFADLCMLDLLAPTGELQRLEVAADDAGAQLVAGSHERPLAPAMSDLQRAVIGTGRSVLFEERPQRERSADVPPSLWDALNADSLLVVPVRARGKTLGALTFATIDSNRRFARADVPFAEELAGRAALAIDNAMLYDQAQHAVQVRDELLQMVSHDLQNPLAVIMMTLDLIRETAPVVERRADALESMASIELAAGRMKALVSDLLDLATIDAGTLSIHMARHTVGALVTESIRLIAPLALRQQIQLRAELSESSLLEVECDRDRILQVLSNILGNALKFTPAQGYVTVRVALHGNEECISIEDTGSGIPEDVLPHIFDRFWHSEQRAKAGTGLGLAICKLLVEAHHGRVWAEPGRLHGTTIHFTLPLTRATPSTQGTQQEDA